MMTASATLMPKTPMYRVAIATCTGTTIEWYDFFVYGTAAALVFPKVFFPALGSTAGTMASFATFGTAFIARPFGALIFGHFGDRIGRKKTLIMTLLLMGIATVLIGVLPSASAIGVAAPIILVLLRLIQGLAVGGEWPGATTLAAEYARPGTRGHYAMFPQLGAAIAFFLSSGTFLVTNLALGDSSEAFVTYGWRVPFVCSFLLVLVGLYVRLKIEETPVFQEAQQRRHSGNAVAPAMDAFKNQPRDILLAAGMLTVLFALFYMGTAYLTSFGTTSAEGPHLSRATVLSLGMVAAVVVAVTTVLSALYSDHVGRRNMIMVAWVLAIPCALVLYPLLDTGSPIVFGLAITVTLGIYGIAYGPTGAYLPEMFETRYRYTAAGVSYSLAGIIGGAAAPILAAWLAVVYGAYAIGILLAALALLSLVCTFALTETKNRELGEAEADQPDIVLEVGG
jgi:metabolite-proton symporter